MSLLPTMLLLLLLPTRASPSADDLTSLSFDEQAALLLRLAAKEQQASSTAAAGATPAAGSCLQHHPYPWNALDYLHATGIKASRAPLIRASYSWRQGIRSHAVLDTDHNIPLRNEEGKQWGESYSAIVGTSWENVAMAPFKAHAFFAGNYKWLLYGHDDTIFFMQNVQRLLKFLSPGAPYAITDGQALPDVVAEDHLPEAEAKCLPCGITPSYVAAHWAAIPSLASLEDLHVAVQQWTACPCNREKVQAIAKDIKTPIQTKAGRSFGGGGLILSVGLMRELLKDGWDAALECIRSATPCGGGDCLFTQCLWSRGYGFTDPGPLTVAALLGQPQHLGASGDTLFQLFDNRDEACMMNAARMMIEDDGTKEEGLEHCRWVVQNVVSYHVGARRHATPHHAAAALHATVVNVREAEQFLDGLARDPNSTWDS